MWSGWDCSSSSTSSDQSGISGAPDRPSPAGEGNGEGSTIASTCFSAPHSDPMWLDEPRRDPDDHEQDQPHRQPDPPRQRLHRAVGLALVRHHVVQRGAEVPQHGDEDRDDQEFLQGHAAFAWRGDVVARGGRRPRYAAASDACKARHGMKGARIAWLALALACAAAFASAGVWQTGRARWKTAYLEAHASALAAAPVGFRAAAD